MVVIPDVSLTLAAAWSARLCVCGTFTVESPRIFCVEQELLRWASRRHWHRRHTLPAARPRRGYILRRIVNDVVNPKKCGQGKARLNGERRSVRGRQIAARTHMFPQHTSVLLSYTTLRPRYVHHLLLFTPRLHDVFKIIACIIRRRFGETAEQIFS